MKRLYTFGSFTLDAPNRVLSCGARELKLEPKAFDLLVFFVSHAGELVNREQIKVEVWETPHLDDNNIDQKIAAIRSVFRKHGLSPEAIQNDRGRGWRFAVEVAIDTEEPSLIAPPSQGSLPLVSPRVFTAPISLLWACIAGLALSVIAVAVMVAAAKRPSPAHGGPQAFAYRPLTTDGKAKDGPLASDDQFVYFAERTGGAENGPNSLAAVPIAGGELVFPPSPILPSAIFFGIARNTQDILFGRRVSDANYAFFVWSQKKRLLEHSLHTEGGARLSPDGRSIAYETGTERGPAALIIRDLSASPNIRKIPVSGIPGFLSWSPDGSRIRFPVQDTVSETSVFWEVRRDGSDLQRLALVSRPQFQWISGCWTRDGRYFIFSELSAVSSNLWIRREDGAARPEPPVQFTNGPMNFDFPETGPRENTVFARGWLSKNQLDRYDASHGKFTPFWEGVPAVDVSFSNDGSWAAYRRPTDDTLWICKSSGAERKQLTQAPLRAYQPHWSPDGKRIAFMGEEPNQPSRIFIIGASGGPLQTAGPADAPEQGVPSWSGDGRYLVFGELRQRRSDSDMMIRLLDLKTRRETILPGSQAKWTPRWSPDGHYIVAMATNFGSLALFDWARRCWTPLVTGRLIDDPAWSLDSRYVHFSALPEDGDVRNLFRVRISDGVVERLAPYPASQFKWSGVGPDGSPLVLNSTRIEEIYAIDFK
jgi:Tol biopolymer transport system component/DNA-binding winged helix-turn-helix (wHTH) protein